MIKNRVVPILCLIALFLAACAPLEGISTDSPAATAPGAIPVTPSPTIVENSPPSAALTATPPVDAFPIATSRGPELHATEPETVSLASGGLQFVEFFRFT